MNETVPGANDTEFRAFIDRCLEAIWRAGDDREAARRIAGLAADLVPRWRTQDPRKTQRKRMIRKLKELRLAMRRRMHQRLQDQHAWLCSVLRGHYAYFGIPGNSSGLDRFRLQVMKAWRRVLLRRSQRPKLSWERFNARCARSSRSSRRGI